MTGKNLCFKVFCLLILTLLHFPLFAETPAKTINIPKIDEDIASTQRSLTTLEREYRNEKRSLAAIEEKLAVVRRDIFNKEKEISATQKRLKQLEREQKQAESSLKEQRKHIHTIIYNAYRHGNQSLIQLILSPTDESLAGVGRKMGYYQHLNKAHQEKIDIYLTTLGNLNRLIRETNQQNNRLQKARQQLSKLEQKNMRQSAQRNETIKNIQHLTLTEQQKLRLLKDERRELENLLQDLTLINPELTELPAKQKSFAESKSELTWPISQNPAVIRHCFGEIRSTKIKWDSVVFAVPEKTEVWAIYQGEVVYAAALQGYGLLLIIDHGDNYMSIYGNNSVLLHKKGDWVSSGQIIGHSGVSGSFGQPQLLFGIRQNSTKFNPLGWLKKRDFKREDRKSRKCSLKG